MKLLITGGTIHGAETYAHNDHRIAMALTLAAFNAKEEVIITGAECVNKTYPHWFEDMGKLGVKVK